MATRRYRAVGGGFAWRLPLVAGLVLGVAALAADWVTTLVAAALALVAGSLERGAVLEASPHGLSKELRIAGIHIRPARAIAWHAVEEITTSWRGPADCTGIVTIVRGGGTAIGFSSAMGYRGYRALVADVVSRAPHARRSDLTEQLLVEPPAPPQPRLRTAAIAAGVLLLVIWAVV